MVVNLRCMRIVIHSKLPKLKPSLLLECSGGRICRFYKFYIEYRPGDRMAHVEFLSRNPVLEDRKNPKGITEKRINLTIITDSWLLAEQQRDKETSSIVSKMRNWELPEDIAKTFELHWKTYCLPVIAKPFRWSAVKNVHKAIVQISKYVRKFVDNYITCRLSGKTGKVQAELHSIPRVNVPSHIVHVDITGKLSG